MFFWMYAIAISVSFLVVAAAAGTMDPAMGSVHMAIAASVAIIFALVSFRDTRKLIQSGAPRPAVCAMSARCMSLIWAWGALALAITYGTGILRWPNWQLFFVVAISAACLCTFVSFTLRADVKRGHHDTKLVKIGGCLACFQLFAMIAIIATLAVRGGSALHSVRAEESWAAYQIFLFGALGLAAVSAHAIKATAGVAR